MRPSLLVTLVFTACAVSEAATPRLPLQQNTPLTRAIRCDGGTRQVLRVTFGWRGCFGGADDEIRLERSPNGSRLSGFVETLNDADAIVRARLDVEAARAHTDALFRLLDAVVEAPADSTTGLCISTGSMFIHIDAACDDRHESRTVKWTRCGEPEAIDRIKSQLEAFVQSRASTTSELTEAERADKRARWSATKDAGR